MMKSACVKTFGEPIEFHDVNIPEPKHDELLVRIQVCGCCHTDIHAMRGDWSVKPMLPLCPGHEGVGVIEKLGQDVGEYALGDRVGVPWLHSTCGECEYCMSGWETLCLHQLNTGYSTRGCFAQYVTIPAKHAVPIPSELSSEQAAPLLCAGVTVYKGIKEAGLFAGQWLCIIGAAGGLGHLAVQYAQAMGLRVITMDIGQAKKHYCEEQLHAELAIDLLDRTSSDSPANQVLKHTLGRGAHGVLVIAAHTSSYILALQCCRSKGTIVGLGMPANPVRWDLTKLVKQGIAVKGSIVGSRLDMMEALDMAARGLVKAHVMIQPVEKVNEVMQEMMENKVCGRIVLEV